MNEFLDIKEMRGVSLGTYYSHVTNAVILWPLLFNLPKTMVTGKNILTLRFVG